MDKDYVSFWVNKDVADQMRKLQSCDNEKRMVEEVAKYLSLNIEAELTNLDEDLARYKAACIVFKNSLKSVYTEQESEIQKFINQYADIMPEVKQNASKFAAQVERELEPVSKQVKDLSDQIKLIENSIKNIDFFYAERMTELVDKIAHLDDKSKDLLHFMMQTYTKDQQ